MNKLIGGGLALALATLLSATPQNANPTPGVNPAGQTAPKHAKKHRNSKPRGKHLGKKGSNGTNRVNPVTPAK